LYQEDKEKDEEEFEWDDYPYWDEVKWLKDK